MNKKKKMIVNALIHYIDTVLDFDDDILFANKIIEEMSGKVR
jgi:hypothetical protein